MNSRSRHLVELVCFGSVT